MAGCSPRVRRAEGSSDLVFTLDRYLAAGGSYDDSAKAVGAHRSTLKYRLQRIREISSTT